MFKHTKTIRRQQRTNCLSVFDHFVGLAFKELNSYFYILNLFPVKHAIELRNVYFSSQVLFPNFAQTEPTKNFTN